MQKRAFDRGLRDELFTVTILLLFTLLTGCHQPPPPGKVLHPDGVTDNTEYLQELVNSRVGEVVLPPGRYLAGTIDMPANVTLRGYPGTFIVINPEKLRLYDSAAAASKDNLLCVFALRGSDVELQKLSFDFSLVDAEGVDVTKRPGTLVRGEGITRVRLTEIVAERSEPVTPLPLDQRKGSRYGPIPKNKASFHLSQFKNSQDITMEKCRGAYLTNMLDLYQCARAVAKYNRALSCLTITTARNGSEYLWHIGNWSRDTLDQCKWWGGNANDQRSLKPGDEGWHTGQTVVRGSRDNQPGFNRYTPGAFDIVVRDNFAEYGRTLAWGSKGRQIIISNNVGRYMTDYVLGSEGGENVVMEGNITLNGRTCGLASYYWSEKFVMTGNVVSVGGDEADPRWSRLADPKAYQGGFVRLHAQAGRERTATGAGQMIISNNVFSNEAPERVSAILIEAGRDVLIQGNKIKNGRIATKQGSGDLTIDGNQFTWQKATPEAAISIASTVMDATIRNNSFLRVGEDLGPSLALSIKADGRKGERYRLVEGNTSRGLPAFLSVEATGDQASVIVRNNIIDGIMSVGLGTDKERILIGDNLDLKTRAEVILADVPSAPPEADEKADSANEGPVEDAP